MGVLGVALQEIDPTKVYVIGGIVGELALP